ncbi:MAG: hypothetical protein K0Q94_5916 [Paenibacillus sp.]|jgi:hypothetical protein|nr:hypothetical protein [Paenibacillus sp.]
MHGGAGTDDGRTDSVLEARFFLYYMFPKGA